MSDPISYTQSIGEVGTHISRTTADPVPPSQPRIERLIDWSVLHRDILGNLDVVAEYEALGVDFNEEAAVDGRRECRALNSEEVTAPAWVNVHDGHFEMSGAHAESLSLIDFAIKYGRAGNYLDALKHFAARAEIQLPEFRQTRDGMIVEAVYRYRDAGGVVLHESIRCRSFDGTAALMRGRQNGQESYDFELDGFVPVPYALPELLSADPDRSVWVVGSEEDVERAIAEGLVATCVHAGAGVERAWEALADALHGRHVIIVPDHDEAGCEHAEGIAERLATRAASVGIVNMLDVPAGGNLVAFLDSGQTTAELEDLARKAPVRATGVKQQAPLRVEDGGISGFLGNPPEPQPIRDELRPVAPLLPELIPAPFRPWLTDIAERMQCPLEFTAVGAIVSVASLVGRRIAFRPKRRDDWTIIPNLWGSVVGNPGVMKSPALAEVLKPLRRLEEQARRRYEEESHRFERDSMITKFQAEVSERALKAYLKEDGSDEARRQELAAQAVAPQQVKSPEERRYILNDPTVEKLGEILEENSNGLLIYRDELMGFLRGLEKSGREQDRAFYLEGWNGDAPFTFDRIGRGTRHIPVVCLSILGGIQPSPLSSYFVETAKLGKGHDGLVSRFQLLMYPDVRDSWTNVDRWPDTDAKERAFRIFECLNRLDGSAIGAENDRYGGPPFLRFAPDAQDLFDEWRYNLENFKLNSHDEEPLVVCHLAKFRSLMPKLALLFHLIDVVDGIATGPVSRHAADLAVAWCDVLESHARRIYEGFGDPVARAARGLIKRIKNGDVPAQFAIHWVAKRDWSGLSTTAEVESAVERLESLRWVMRENLSSGPKGGRPKTIVHVNPRLLAGGA